MLPALSRRHWRLGWFALATFVALGLCLELMHGLKSSFYLDASIRREMWTLAHAHGSLISIVHLVFASFLSRRERAWDAGARASQLLIVALLLVPSGFFLGGLTPTSTDPGLGIWLVPIGGLALLAACVLAGLARD